MKKLRFILPALLLVSSTTFAAPQTDFTAGKVSVDLSYQPSLDFKLDAYGDSGKGDGKTKNVDFGITYGLGGNWGLQYAQNGAKTDTYTEDFSSIGLGTVRYHDDLKIQQFNVIYHTSENNAAFVGFTRGTNDIVTSAGDISGKRVNGFHVGATEVVPVNDKLSSYGVVSVGNKIINAEFGLSQQLNENLDLNLFYRYTKYKDLEFEALPGATFNNTVRGLGVGATLKF